VSNKIFSNHYLRTRAMRRLLIPFVFAGTLSMGVAHAGEYSLVIDHQDIDVGGRTSDSITLNGQFPGPTLHFKEGENVVINVTNKLKEDASVHWHGFILPGDMDGVPGFNGYPGIKPGKTFTYKFKIKQNGTYWYHSHSGGQEQEGLYGAIVIDPASGGIKADKDYVVVLSDFTTDKPSEILANLKADSGYYNYSKRTVGDFFHDARKKGLGSTVQDRLSWGAMRMDPTDLADVTNYTFLVNGKSPSANWTGLFKRGERIRLRFVNASAMTYFDLRIPGLKMIVVAADGQDVMPVPVDEIRVAIAETYDVIVVPSDDRAYTIFAQSLDRTGYARGTLAPRAGMTAAIPAMRPRSQLTMSDMNMSSMKGMDESSMSGMNMPGMSMDSMNGNDMAKGSTQGMHMNADTTKSGMPMSGMDHSKMNGMNMPGMSMDSMNGMAMKGMDHSKTGGMNMSGMQGDAADTNKTEAPQGWYSGFPAGEKVLSYADLKSLTPQKDIRPAGREIVVHLGGNMERYIWTLNGKKFSDAKPIELKYGERVKLTFVNDTMMAHPMHLHGMFVQLENGQPAARLPNKHIVSVPPGQSYSVLLTADEVGEWAFHCHLLYHMASGMMNKVVVARMSTEAAQ